MALLPRSWDGLPTVFGEEWCLDVNVGSMGPGGQMRRVDGSSPDDLIGILAYIHGYGGNADTDMGRLAATVFRAAHRGGGWHTVGLQGTFTDNGANRTWMGPPPLLPRQLSYSWAAGVAVTRGARRTFGGFTYYCHTGGTTAAPGPSGSGVYGTHLVTDGGGVVWRCVAVGERDLDIPDLDRIGGVGRDVGGIWRPEGVLRQIRRTYGGNLREMCVIGYSTGEGMADVLQRNFPDLISGTVGVAGVCALNLGDLNNNGGVIARRRRRLHIHGDLDVTVNRNAAPPASSSAAVMPHGSAENTLTSHMLASGHGSAALVDTGQRITWESTQLATPAIVYAPAGGDVLDELGRPVPMRLWIAPNTGHVPSTTNEGHRQVTNFLDDYPGAP